MPERALSSHLFVYGSLLSGARHEMGARLRAGARLEAQAVMPGRLYDLGAYPGAVHEPGGAELVIGEVWRLLHPMRLLARLDAYEGCAPGQPRPCAFCREVVEVLTPGNRTRPAWVYLWSGDETRARRVTGGDWLRHMSASRQRPMRRRD